MSPLQKLNKRLNYAFGGAVHAREDEGRLVLEGALDNWQQVVAAGRMAVNKKRWSVVNDIKFHDVEPMRVPKLHDESLSGASPDVLIIGAGVVGCAIARELSRYELNILLVEKEHDVALHASGRNDGMVHPGIDLRRGQVKQRYNLRGNRMYDELCHNLGVNFKRTGQYLCFSQKWMIPLLFLAPLYWHSLGVPAHFISQKNLRTAEPGTDKSICAGIFFPSAGLVCPYGLTIALAENAVQNGVHLALDTAVLSMAVDGGKITAVETNRGTVRPAVVINAAGVFADEAAKMAGDRFFSIHPRKGTNSILDKKSADQVHTILSAFDTHFSKSVHTKGGGLVRTVDGNLLVGPDAVETPERENFATDSASISATFEKHKKASPALRSGDIITYFTGVRAPTYEEDFVISRGRATRNIVHAAGIQSPGLTAAPAIGEDVAGMAIAILKECRAVQKNENFNPINLPIPRPASLPPEERDTLIKENPDYGIIVCRCEEVSRGEILDALRRPVHCDTVDGVKRRVRPGMGRCQGGFCSPLVAKIIAEENGIPLSDVLKSGDGSQIVFGSAKGADAV